MNQSFSSHFDPSKCRDRVRLLDAYLDGELEPAQLLDVEGHVAECVGCRGRVELHPRTTSAGVAEADDQDVRFGMGCARGRSPR